MNELPAQTEVVGDRWVTIDRDWIITATGAAAPGHTATAVGMNVWEAFPGSEPHFRPIYEAAWRRGMASGLAHYNDVLADLQVFVRDDQLHVSFSYVTVAGLREALELMDQSRLQRVSGSHRTSGAPVRESARHLMLVRP